MSKLKIKAVKDNLTKMGYTLKREHIDKAIFYSVNGAFIGQSENLISFYKNLRKS